MIVPIAFSVKREREPEIYAIQTTDLLPRWDHPAMRVTMALLDTDDGALGFSAKVLFDSEAEPWHGMATIYDSRKAGVQLPSFASREYMTALRDKLNELLGET